jgi:hypothetical protein
MHPSQLSPRATYIYALMHWNVELWPTTDFLSLPLVSSLGFWYPDHQVPQFVSFVNIINDALQNSQLRTHKFLLFSQVPEDRWSSQLKCRGCDNVLRDQRYSTSQGVIRVEYGAMVKWWLTSETLGNSKKNFFHCYIVHNENFNNLYSTPNIIRIKSRSMR